MTNSEANADAAKLLDALLAALATWRTQVEVDERIDAASAAHAWPDEDCRSQRQFLNEAGELLRSLNEHGRAFPRTMTPRQAQAEAVHLLQRSYQGQHGYGYTSALLDAMDTTQNGPACVLEALVSMVKDQERKEYVRGVLAAHVDPLDWNINCELARLLKERMEPYLPAKIAECAPEQLAEDWPALLIKHMETDEALWRDDPASSD